MEAANIRLLLQKQYRVTNKNLYQEKKLVCVLAHTNKNNENLYSGQGIYLIFINVKHKTAVKERVQAIFYHCR